MISLFVSEFINFNPISSVHLNRPGKSNPETFPFLKLSVTKFERA